jgi:hypothetical protein
MNKTTIPAPVFKRRVLAARMLAEMTGVRWVWDEFEVSGHFVLHNKSYRVIFFSGESRICQTDEEMPIGL